MASLRAESHKPNSGSVEESGRFDAPLAFWALVRHTQSDITSQAASILSRWRAHSTGVPVPTPKSEHDLNMEKVGEWLKQECHGYHMLEGRRVMFELETDYTKFLLHYG